MDEIANNHKTFHKDNSYLNFSISQISYSFCSDYKEEKEICRLSGTGICFFNGFQVIHTGYKSSLIQINLYDMDDADPFHTNTQLQTAISEGWAAFAALYYEEDENDLEGISYVDDLIRSNPKIFLEIYLGKEKIDELVDAIRKNNINSMSIECYFINLLSDTHHNPGGVRYIPPKDGNTFNCVGEMTKISFTNKTCYFNYREILGNQISTVINPLNSDLVIHAQKEQLEELKKLYANQEGIDQKIILELSKIKYVLFFILILLVIHLFK